MLPPQHHELQHNMPEPRARAPQIEFIDPAPAVHEAFRDNILGREVADVLEGLVEDICDDLQECKRVDEAV